MPASETPQSLNYNPPNIPCYTFGKEVRRVDFISDLHLASFRPKTLATFQKYLAETPADALVILGDLFEVWIGDDTISQPFEQDCVSLLAKFSKQRQCLFLHGNRDFLVGQEFSIASGCQLLSDPAVLSAFGTRVLCTHGDAWCLSDIYYMQFRAQVRQLAWQDQFLALPLESRQLLARKIRTESQAKHGQAAEYADLDKATCLNQLERAYSHILIHGHTHRPSSEKLSEACVRHVLADWEFESEDGSENQRGDVLIWTSNGIRRESIQSA